MATPVHTAENNLIASARRALGWRRALALHWLQDQGERPTVENLLISEALKGGRGSGYHAPHLGPPAGQHGGSRPRGGQATQGALFGEEAFTPEPQAAERPAGPTREQQIEQATERGEARSLPRHEAEQVFWRRSYDLLPEGTEGVLLRGAETGEIGVIRPHMEHWQTSRARGVMPVNYLEYTHHGRHGDRRVTMNVAAEAFEPLDPALSYRLAAAQVQDFAAANRALKKRARKAWTEIENALIAQALALKGSGGSGNWAHTSESRIGKGPGGSDPGGGLGALGVAADSSPQKRRAAAQERQGKEKRIEVTNDSDQFARDLEDATDGVPLGQPVRVNLVNAGRERTGHVVLGTLKGRFWLSLPTRGKADSTTFYSIGRSGKQRGVLQFEHSQSNRLLSEQGYDPATGYLVHPGPRVSWTRKGQIENDLIAQALAAKGGLGSGNWAHTSRTRVGVGRGGSDPGGGLGALGVDRSATVQQRREAAQARRGKKPTPPEFTQAALFGEEALTLEPPAPKPPARPVGEEERRVSGELEEVKTYLKGVAVGTPEHESVQGYARELETWLDQERAINEALWDQHKIGPGEATASEWGTVADRLQREGYDLYKSYDLEGIEFRVAELRGAREDAVASLVGGQWVICRRGAFSRAEAARIVAQEWRAAKDILAEEMGVQLQGAGFKESEIAGTSFNQRQQLLRELGAGRLEMGRAGRAMRIGKVPMTARERVMSQADWKTKAAAARTAISPVDTPTIGAYHKMELADLIRLRYLPQIEGEPAPLNFPD